MQVIYKEVEKKPQMVGGPDVDTPWPPNASMFTVQSKCKYSLDNNLDNDSNAQR